MNRGRFFENPSFVEYVRTLGRLHRLMRAQRDESAEGEVLREQMDRPGEALAEDEIRAVTGISGDLASIGGHRVNGVATTPPAQLKAAAEAIDRHDAIRALAILREHAHETPLTALSFLRGRAFACVDQFEIAADFFEHAKESKPDDPSFGVAWLDALSRADLQRARAISRDILKHRADYPPPLLFKAADIRFEEAYILPDVEQPPALEELVSAFGDAIVGLETVEVPAVVRSGAYALLAICQRRLGATGDARCSLDRALTLDPNFAEALMSRGTLLYDCEREQAVKDLRRAVELAGTLPWPCFLLTQDALENQHFEEAIHLSKAALRSNSSHCLRAHCLQSMAIAMANLDYPPDAVRAVFQDAIQLAPDEVQFQKNLAHFENAVRTASAGLAQWERPPANRIRQLMPPERQQAGVT